MTRKEEKTDLKLLLILFIVSVLLIAADQYTKYLVRENLQEGERIELIKDFSYITHWKNPGVIYGLFSDLPENIRVLTLSLLVGVSLILLTIFAFRLGKADWLSMLGVACIFAGAAGNQLDRMLQGQVTDFILFQFGSWIIPAFNIADSAVFVGVSLLIIDTLFPGLIRGKGKKSVEANVDKE